MKNIVVYHNNCSDGKMSAAVAHHFLNKSSLKTEFRAHDYNNVEQVESLMRFAQDCEINRIFILDFSFSTEILNQLARYCEQVVVLDHHESAIERISTVDLRSNVLCVLDKHYAGCMLTWMYFNGFVIKDQQFKKPLLDFNDFPTPVRLVGVRDVWTKGWQQTWPDAEPFHAAVSSKPLSAFIAVINDHLEYHPDVFRPKVLHKLLDEGKVALNVLEDIRLAGLGTASDFFIKHSFGGETRQLKVQLNYLPYQVISEHAEKVKADYDCIITANLIGADKVKLSFRSGDGWAKPLAASFNTGGGGHLNAAGCVVSTDQFNSFVTNKKL